MLDASQALLSASDESETLSENVFRRIQAAIVKGEIAPGSKISEPELARTYGISRGPLREAIHRLEGQRLLVRVPHVGARVVSLNHAELIELYEIRESLEGMACRLAAERMSLAEIDELRRVLDTHERDAAFQAGVGYYQQEGDFDFHYRIIQAAATRPWSRCSAASCTSWCACTASSFPPRPIVHARRSPNTIAFSMPLPTVTASWPNS